jgi:uncharacterized phage infection (PIP) family protein YhgE
MTFPTILTYLTLAAAAVTVVVLVVYLVLIIIALRRAGDHLAQLAGGLQAIVDNTKPLEEHLTTINGALGTLQEGLAAVDHNLVGVAEVFELEQ